MSKPTKRSNVTLAEVAARAGVSRMTVSKALRNTGSISADTRAKILGAVEELGYVKNSLAGSLSSQRSEIIGIVIPSASDSVFAEVLSGTNSVIRPKGLSTLIGETLFDPQVEYEILSTIMQMQPAGLIVSGGMNRLDKTRTLLERRRCPMISIWDSESQVGDCTVGLSHRLAGQMMAEHFLAKGFSNIAYVGSELELDVCARQRFEGFRDTLAAAGRSVRTEISATAPRQTPSGRTLTETLLAKWPDTDAIQYLNDAMAIGGLSWLYDNSIDVPGQVAAAGFNGTATLQTIRTRLTTINAPRRFIGEAAAGALLNLIEDSGEPKSYNVELDFIQGNTT
ncbi:LacI family DNA-binding transcriptional regulator [Hoeflea ulvae]|uniref:LacI family DNA-binding transcriptional regulator n=1 Tax=Hoeflea ulvae TaxID=2983764 RepID=A0ABT3YGW3_9HYPH|nr:LacI family DNA-binding transcriptional regulator [Hoeflea ulvae]MCY0095140.1 LacI family DNA-binding transcriptional regulator [Hoeflea ulvae]